MFVEGSFTNADRRAGRDCLTQNGNDER